MNRICVFGASRGTGKELVQIASQQGLSVTAAVRNPLSVQKSENVRVVASDVYDTASLGGALAENDAVVSTIGPVRRESSTTIYSVGIMNVARQMEQSGPSRLIVVDSIGVDPNFDLPWNYRFAMKFIATPLYGFAFKDAAKMERLLTTTKLNWTVVRAPWLVSAAPHGFRSSIGKRLHNGPKLGRRDLAEYLLTILEDKRTFKTWTEVAW
jgi:putative NADH-flavin reductase